jgi:hypothetical protein
MGLRKQPGLYLLCNFQLLGSAAFGLDSLLVHPAARFQTSLHLVESGQAKRIAVRVFKAREDAAPRGVLRRKLKTHSALAPFLELGVDVFRKKENPAVSANQFPCFGIWLGSDQRQGRGAIRRRNLDPAHAVFKAVIHDQLEPKLIEVRIAGCGPGHERK